MEKTRIEYLDTAKGIGIFCVCLGHACTNQAMVTDCKYVDIIRFVTLFHMALFFFINGILYSSKYAQKPIHGMIHKLKAYYIPFVTYNLLFWLFHNLFAKWHMISGELDAKDYAYVGAKAYVVSFIKSLVGYRQRFAGAMWFLEALLILSIVFILLDYVVSRWFARKRILGLTIGVAILVFINHSCNLISLPYIPASITQMLYWGFNGLLFFYLGYVYKVGQFNEKLASRKALYASLGALILIIVVVLMQPRVVSVITNESMSVFAYGGHALWGKSVPGKLSLLMYLVYALVCLCGILMVLLVSQFELLQKCSVLTLFGRYSLHIMCLQFLAFKPVSLLMIKIYGFPIERLAEYPVIHGVDGVWWILYTLAGCVLPVLVVKTYELLKSRIELCMKKRSEV